MVKICELVYEMKDKQLILRNQSNTRRILDYTGVQSLRETLLAQNHWILYGLCKYHNSKLFKDKFEI